MTSIRCVAEVGAVLGGSPLWDPKRGCLWWLDIKADRKVSHLLRLDLDGRFARVELSCRMTALAPCPFGAMGPQRVTP
jgi:sugar lactone lactonase YvrE